MARSTLPFSLLRARLVAVVARQRQQCRIEVDGLAVAFKHCALEIVVLDDAAAAAEDLEGFDMPAQEVLHARIEVEAQEDAARPGKHHHEGHQGAPRRPTIRWENEAQSHWHCSPGNVRKRR